MPAPAPEQIDVQALLERLREEVRWGGNGASSLTLRARARSAAEQFWAVTAERPPHGSALTRLLKKGLRKLMRWYVEPLAQQQRSFNDAALKLIDALFEELDLAGAERGQRGRLIAELEERLVRLEGLPVEQRDLLDHLDALPDATLGAIFAGQVVEHLPPPALARFLELANAKLRDGGLLIAETINPLSPIALRNYFSDLTHAQPLVPETL